MPLPEVASKPSGWKPWLSHKGLYWVLRCLLPMALVLVVLALYGQFVWNPIVFDDMYLFLADDRGHMPVMDIQYAPFELRSLPYATLAWTLSYLGNSLIYFRIGNLVLHAAVVLAVYGCILGVRPLYASRRRDGTDHSVAAALALLFAVHPVAVFAAGYLVQRTLLFATLFSVLAIWAYAHGSARQRPRACWFALGLYYLAVFSKEHAVMLVAIFPLITVSLHTDWRQTLRKEWPPLLLGLALAVVVFLMRRYVVAQVYEPDAAALVTQSAIAHPYFSSVLTQAAAFFHYIALWLLPNVAWMSIDMRVPIAQSLFSLQGGLFLVYLAWGALASTWVLRHGRWARLGLVMLFPWLMGLTELVTVRVQEPFVLYRSYLWAAGALCFVAVCPLPRLGRRGWAGVAVLALVLFGLSMERLQTFSHPYLVWDDAERLLAGNTGLPGASRIYYNRGTQLLQLQKWPEAEKDLQTAIRLQPDFAPAYGNLGVALLRQSAWAASAEAFGHAADLDRAAGRPPQERYYRGRAEALEQMPKAAPAR